MGIVIDIILVLVVFIFGVAGLKKGFLKSVLGLFGFVGCFALAILLREQFASFLNLIGVGGLAEGFVKNRLAELNAEFITTRSGNVADLLKVVQNANLNPALSATASVILNGVAITSPVTVAEIIAPEVASYIILIFGVLLGFILLRLIVLALSKIFKRIESVKFMAAPNRFIGFLFGLIKGVFAVGIVFVSLCLLSFLPEFSSIVSNALKNTQVAKFLYNLTNEVLSSTVGGWLSNN